MTVHTHEIEKTAEADFEELPDISGSWIRYAGKAKCGITVGQRRNDEPTLEAGVDTTVGGRSGLLIRATARLLANLQLDGALVWEARYDLRTAGDSV
jgi:hypothetical protein